MEDERRRTGVGSEKYRNTGCGLYYRERLGAEWKSKKDKKQRMGLHVDGGTPVVEI